jgi:chaperonin GroES
MLTPIKNLVMVEKLEEENKTESGIIVKADPTEASRATVLALGPECENAVAVGDVVILDYNKAWQVKYQSKVYYFLEEKNIIARV